VGRPGRGFVENAAMLRSWLPLGVPVMALGVLALHLATNAQYDFHRDPLYYLDSARHPAWGYVDYPPVTPTIARLSLWIFGPSVWGLRLWPSLVGAVLIILSALIARGLGGGRTGVLLAATAAATSLVLLGANWLFQTVTFDQLIWISALLLLARLIRTGNRRLWLPLGVVLGAGLETKYTVIALIVGLAAGVVVTPLRRDLLTPWPWLAAGVALLIFAPNLVWQLQNGWPSIQYTLNHKSAQSIDFSPLTFLGDQLALIGPVAIPLWLAGLYWLLRSAALRALGVAALVPFLIYLFAGKSYYVGPLHPVLLAAGACALEQSTAARLHWLRPTAAIALTAQALVLLPLALPVLPEAAMAHSPLPSARKDFADTVGWHDLVAQVAQIYESLPPTDRATAVILTDNYGEAGAIDTYGGAAGLPHAYSGELTYWYWKPPSLSGPVIAVGIDRPFISTLFDKCTDLGSITNSYGLHNEEYGKPLTLCRDPTLSFDATWSRLKAFR
jgi:4-amino-4-deoxy-L-arabinose transferase-like glycosyltransferase